MFLSEHFPSLRNLAIVAAASGLLVITVIPSMWWAQEGPPASAQSMSGLGWYGIKTEWELRKKTQQQT